MLLFISHGDENGKFLFMYSLPSLTNHHFHITLLNVNNGTLIHHDDVIKWKHFLRYWAFVRGSHRSTVNSPHKGQWRGALMFSLICTWIKGWVKNGGAGDLRRHRAHYDVTVMTYVTVGKSFYFLLTITIFAGGIVGAFHTDKQGIWLVPFEPYVHDKRQKLIHLWIASARLLSGYCFVSGILLVVADAKQI